jgi:hypothetical protein
MEYFRFPGSPKGNSRFWHRADELAELKVRSEREAEDTDAHRLGKRSTKAIQSDIAWCDRV